MAEANPKQDFSKQISETRQCIKDRFKKSHSALVTRENILLARVDSIEHEYNQKIQNELTHSLNEARSFVNEKLKPNQLTKTRVLQLDYLSKYQRENDQNLGYQRGYKIMVNLFLR